jgi:hypothetical protein
MDYPRGIWIDVPLHQLVGVLSLRQALLERIEKADGHINAAERMLWHETDRGLWSARQAKARIGEVWMWLTEQRTDALPDVERYLDRETTDERLAGFADARKSERLEAAWAVIDCAEHAIIDDPFPELTRAPRTDAERTGLISGISREDRYIAALRACLTVVEDAFAERFAAVQQGTWLRLHDGALGRVVSRRGLRIDVFMPERAWSDPREAHRAYVLRLARIEVLSEPSIATIGIPAYYWLCQAYAARRAVWSLLKDDNGQDVKAVVDALGAATDAAAKVWLSQCFPDHAGIYWVGALRQNIEALGDAAPRGFSRSLRRVWKLVETLSGSAHLLRGEKRPSWPLKVAVAAESLSPILGELGDALQGQVRIPDGARVIVAGARVGEVVSRQGKRLSIRLTQGEEMELSLFEDFLELCPGHSPH